MDADRPISEQYRITAKRWVDADAAASLLEETKSAFLAQLMANCGEGLPVSRAEMMVKGSEQWKSFINSMVAARKAASLLKVQLEFIRMRHSEQQSAEATARAERRL